jgi:hypothetical protein
MKRVPWEFLLALVAGLALGLIYAWIVAPLRVVDTAPDTLRPDFKSQYRSLIAAAYSATGQFGRARARVELLGDPNPVAALEAQAQQMLAAGDPFEHVRQVAQLASDLGNPGQVAPPASATPTSVSAPSATPERVGTDELGVTPGLTETVIPGQTIEPPAEISTSTPRPTSTATRAPGEPFELVEQEDVCEADVTPGLLQVVVMDGRRRPLPGYEIVVTWTGGEEHFFTGLKPELGDGYADFVMQAGVEYSVRVAEGGVPIPAVGAPPCAAADGTTFTGGIRLTFQQ